MVRLGSLLSNELFPFLAIPIACTYTYSSNVKYFWSANFRLFFFFFYQLEKLLETLKQKPYLKSLAQNLRNPGPTEGTRFLHLPRQTTAIDQISDRIFTQSAVSTLPHSLQVLLEKRHFHLFQAGKYILD